MLKGFCLEYLYDCALLKVKKNCCFMYGKDLRVKIKSYQPNQTRIMCIPWDIVRIVIFRRHRSTTFIIPFKYDSSCKNNTDRHAFRNNSGFKFHLLKHIFIVTSFDSSIFNNIPHSSPCPYFIHCSN